MHAKRTLKVTGTLRTYDLAGNLLGTACNMVVYDGIEVIVDALRGAATNIGGFKWVGFGITGDPSTSGMTGLVREVAFGSYARLNGTQGEGANSRTYRVSGTWLNTTGAQRVITEYGLFSAANSGDMLCRVSTEDADPPLERTVEVGDGIAVIWDIAFEDG